MKGIQKRLGSLLMAAVMLLSLAVTPAMAAGEKEPPTEVKSLTAGEIYNTILSFQFENTDWLNAITAVAVNDDTYQSSGSVNSFTDAGNWGMGTAYGAYGSYTALQIVMKSGTTYPATIKFSATGYKDLTVKVEKSGSDYTATVIADSGSSGSEPEPPTPPEKKTIDLSKVSFAKSSDGNDWQVTFGEDGYAEKITAVTVNGKPWNATSFLADGGKYKISDGKLLFARNSYGGTAALKSGDVITITADGYEALTFKLVINTDGSASVEKNDGKGDPLELHVKLVGSFEAAIVGQKNYDGVSSASVGGASSNKNSAVTVYGALVKKGNDPTDKDWEELNHQSEIQLVGSKCSVSIVPDTEKGTPAAADSGMEGVYMTISSDLTLNGTPKDAGSYLISVHIEDNQGRTATSNALPFRIYTGEETLADQIKTENLNQYSNGLYAWDIMEPWAIKNFGSNVENETESVRVPKDLEVWYGSHESGTYGYLGYDQEWEKVEAGEIPQTLYIPNGCNLTLVNMEILSSVRIVVENGGKLTLSDSVVQGIIDVKSGGTFSMNYDAYNNKFTTGASICGQLRMESGSTLENAAIYSHTNYLANGDLTDRSNDEAVVLTTGNVTVKGKVFISGDAGGSKYGQTGLRVKDGTLTLDNDAVLAVYGGKGTVVDTKGGTAIELDNGTITGNGKVIAIGGSVLWEKGGNAVTGTGTISTREAFLQGATASKAFDAEPGKAVSDTVKVTSASQHVQDGTVKETTANDPLADLYWTTGTQATPDLSKYTIAPRSGYVLMNIPYAEFYAAEKDANGTAAKVDAVSSATKQKTRSTLAAGSYHKNADGTDISGVIYPVYVADLSALYGYNQVKDSDRLTITVTPKDKEITTTYTGKDTLFENPDYAYYVLSEVPKSYKTLTVKSDGSFSFGKATAKMTELGDTSVSLKTGSHRAYYKLEVSEKVSGKLPKNIKSMVSAVTLHTTDGQTYGLRHVAEIWHGTKLGFGVDSGLQDKTIDKITYYLNDGTIQTIAANIKVPKSTQNVTATVENALNTAREAVVTVENLPADFVAEYTVTSGNTDLSEYNFAVENGKLRWTGEPAFGTYTLTITDKSGVYAPVSTSFELKTADIIAKYDASKKALVKASDAITEEQFAAYLKAISAVSVDGTSYAASDKGSVTIVKTDGVIDLTAQPFSKGEGASYNLVVKATGYQDLTFTVTTAKKSNSGSGSSSSGSSGSSYAVSAPSTKNGDVTVSPKNASKGDRVTVTVTPDKGYELDKLTVKDASGNKLKLTDKGNGKYTFTMPGSKVTVSAEFVEEQAASIFADVPADAYYAKAVEWAVKKGITNGKANGLFGSNDPCTRGQIVTFLWRAAGSPAPKGTATVPADVLPGSYCYDAVAWALENGITNGLADGTFGVNSTCTRGQSVTFLYRAMGTAPTTVNGFTDVAANTFCAEAVAWAVENGVTNGTSASAFSPNAGCTRAQIVTFLYRAYQSK
ncbi:S-layer homology domain-containing protein [Dysosmobacter sp.]|uniref:S-layer homology domain-containing protein n=1 Tax=Dysosmobacter sp. TaxID=2591382 RepID=UPI003AB25C23